MKYSIVSLLLLISCTAFSQQENLLTFTIHLNDTVQKIRNIGASACWYAEEIGAKWPEAKKQRVTELLFSREISKDGQPKGIGLSAFRYNIGAGTAEQGDSGGIKDPSHRVECFLLPDGTYDWNKQKGYTWMLQQAKKYKVQDLIAFVNSPPVQFTKNGLGFKLEKDFSTNLKEDKYEAYADFLTEVVKHFDKTGIHFNYISPINEPQWDWSGTIGQAKQEGSPWTNEEMFGAVKALNNSLAKQKLSTKILLTEAAMLDHLVGTRSKSGRQIASFWDPKSSMYVGSMSHATPYVEGHGYFTDKGDSYLIGARSKLRDTLSKYGRYLEYWQSEYCMLGDGYKENSKEPRRSAIDCALFLAKVIHHDLVIGNATAWQYWNSFEPGSSDNNTRYYLVALNPKRAEDPEKLYSVTKNLWALGHYSLLVRPGMYRVETTRNDKLEDSVIAQGVMISAFKNIKERKLVVNIINYTTEDKQITIVPEGLGTNKEIRLIESYITSAKEGDDLKRNIVNTNGKKTLSAILLPARSINSYVFSF